VTGGGGRLGVARAGGGGGGGEVDWGKVVVGKGGELLRGTGDAIF